MLRTNSSSCSSLNRLTVQEVSALIGDSFPSKDRTEVVDFRLRPFSAETIGYMGIHELLSVEARDDLTKKKIRTLTFFVKSEAPTGNSFDRLTFLNESKFYGDVVPQLLQNFKGELWAAKCHLVKDELIILENLRTQGFKLTSGQLQTGELRSAVASVARFHASSILLEEKLQTPLRDVYPGFFRTKVYLNDDEGFAWKWMLAGIEVVEAVARNLGLESKHTSTAYNLMRERIKPVESRMNVLCHRDLWSNNLMFKYEKDETISSCRILDFQMVGYTSYAVDLVEFFHFNCSMEVRRKLEKELIKLYHSVLVETLRNHGLDSDRFIGLEEVLQDVEEKRICGLVTAAQCFPIALLNKELAREYTKDIEMLDTYSHVSRKEFVLQAMRLDESYRGRIEESVRELMEFMQKQAG